jgi:hypothetical protein
VRTDPLQRLHTLHNLAETLDAIGRKAAAAAARSGAAAAAAPQVARTLRDSSLASEAAGIRDAYLASRVADLAAQRAAYAKAKEAATGSGKRPRKGRGRGDAGRVAEFAALLAPGAGGASAEELEGGDSSEGDEGSGPDAAEVAALRDGWYVAAIDALERAGRGEEVAEAVKEALMEREQYDRAGAQNATSIARR